MTCALNAQRRTDTPSRRAAFAHDYHTVITANLPTIIQISKWPGIGIGVSFAHYLDKKARFSAAVSVLRGWGGTFTGGKFSPGEQRTNLQIKLFQPAAYWHPGGNRSGISLGISAPLGSLTRRDDSGTNNSGSLPYSKIVLLENPALIGLMAHAAITIFSRGHFVTVISLAGGAILSAGSTRGGIGEFGLAFGGAF